MLSLVQTAIEQMDPIDREVLALRHFEELTNSEVAETLGIEQKAASIRYVRALRRLKEILAQVPDLAKRA
jgi:RNA polymerase sigma-70 factor (ECF subfamily)